MIDNFKIGINLGWHGENKKDQEILIQYIYWFKICHENNIKIVRIFLARWCINALFEEKKLSLLENIIKEAQKRNIEIIIVLNHFTDFHKKVYRDLEKDHYTWKTYPLKKGKIEDFFKEVDTFFLLSIKAVLEKIKDYHNVRKIELFNEIDLLDVNKNLLIKWINNLFDRLAQYHQRFYFYVSMGDQRNFRIFSKRLKINFDIHLYNFPFEYAFKNIEFFLKKLPQNKKVIFGEYAKFSDYAYLEDDDSLGYFCSGLWGAYLSGLKSSPLHWWWEGLLNSKKYLLIIKVFNNINDEMKFNKLNIFNRFNLKNVTIRNRKFIDTKKHNKILFRLQNLLHDPYYIRNEFMAIIKLLTKYFYNFLDRDKILIRAYENKNFILFYCEPKNSYETEFELEFLHKGNIRKMKLINLFTGENKNIPYQKNNNIYKVSANFSSINLIKVLKNE